MRVFLWRQPQNTGDLKDVSYLISGARDVIANATGDCAKLLEKDALKKFNKIATNIQFNGDVPVTLETGFGEVKAGKLGDVGYIDAVTEGQNIYLNPNGITFDRTVTRGGKSIFQSAFDKYGVNQDQLAFAVIVHEFLHTTGKFKADRKRAPDGSIDVSKSKAYTAELLEKCFRKKN